MKLKEIAHSRTGDKGDISNISLIPYKKEDYEMLKEKVTPEVVKAYFGEICKGEVVRYDIDSICTKKLPKTSHAQARCPRKFLVVLMIR